jgi:ABC-type bacteriocin/lantibiotic exporter with double-glycine peptidase domain
MAEWTTHIIPCLLLSAAAIAAERPGLWLDVPFVKQEKNGCGAASIAMVMQYWQRQEKGPAVPDAQAIQRALYSRRARGIYASDLELYLQQHGFRTFAIQGQWTDLEHHLEKGRPLIVAQASGRDDLHFSVVTGMDPQQEIVLQNDPARRQLLKQHRSEFEREWKLAGNWMLLALPERDPSSSH